MFEIIVSIVLIMQFIMTVALYAELIKIADNVYTNGQNFVELANKFEKRKQ